MKGNIGVTSTDIFPLIKKFMYNDQDIFIREIVSNAVDATQKLITLVNSNIYNADISKLEINVIIDKTNKTITVSDPGIGMTSDEVEKYINQIAFSGATDFLDKYKNVDIIGHFGLGFYSSFMVSDKVVIITKSYKENSIPVKWSCDGNIEFELDETEKDTVGTDVIMYINDEYKEYLEYNKIKDLLVKYSKFLPVKINIVEKQEAYTDSSTNETIIPEDKSETITSTNALWTKQPSTLKDEDYINFYKELYPGRPEPLFWIHLNIDMPFTFTGILYFPAFDQSRPIFEQHHLNLYCNRVFVTDDVKGILPDYLALLHGVIDSPDIPLNVSRSFLQNDSNVKKISTYITNKVMSALKSLMKKDRKKYEEKWDTIKLFINLGVITLPDVYEKAKDIILLTDIDNNKYTFDEYYEFVKDNQTDKDGNVVYLYTYDKNTHYTYIEKLKDYNYNILLMNDQYSAFEVQAYETEQRDQNIKYKRIDADIPEKLIEKETEDKKKELSENLKSMLISLFDTVDKKLDKINLSYKVEALGKDNLPITVISDEFYRRMKEMSMMNNQGIFLGMDTTLNLIINSDAKVIKKILKNAEKEIGVEISDINNKLSEFNKLLTDTSDDEEKKSIQENINELLDKKQEVIKNFAETDNHINEIIDIALLQYGLLTGEDLTKFIKRSVKLIEK